jgi:hypothetical protein
MDDDHSIDAKKALEEARSFLTDLLTQREALDIAIAKQQRRVAAFAILADESEESDRVPQPEVKEGLTDAVRDELKAAGPNGLTPKEIRTRLIQLYFPVSEYKNFLASLGTILTRLIESHEVKRAIIDTHTGHDESVYQWIPKYGATNSLANMILKQGGKSKSRFRPRFTGRFERK